MTAVEALRLARENGVCIRVSGADLILTADQEPAPAVVEIICTHKPEIIVLVQEPEGDWTAEDWRAFFDERGAITEYDGGQTRIDAESIAFECCIVEWLNRHPKSSDFGHCAGCGRDGHAVVPFGTESYGHTWLHPSCWERWFEQSRDEASRELHKILVRRSSHADG